MMEVREREGPRGGEYIGVDLNDGRALHVSRKPEDKRVWLGRPDQPEFYRDQRGGIGTISKFLDEWRQDPAMADMYEALVALDTTRGRQQPARVRQQATGPV